ncbi:hypothetical protein RFI_35569, partial [Reticulomyxa filosa]
DSSLGTSELLLRLTESIYSSFDNNGISSAYDSVWRDGLRNKMRKEFGLKGRMYWLDSFELDSVGVPQGHHYLLCYSYEKEMEWQLNQLQKSLDNGHQNGKSDHVKNLGLIVDQQMTLQQHINYVYGKASKKLGYLTFLCLYKGIRPSLSVHNNYQTITVHSGMDWKGFKESTAYDTVNVISQTPPLELRRQQEEVKLYHKCIRWRDKFPDHNL